MVPNDIDPSLCAGEPLLESLEDGFSPPAGNAAPQPSPSGPDGAAAAEVTLAPKSPF